MRLLIDTKDITFRVAGLAKPRTDYRDKSGNTQATTSDADGRRPLWTVRLDAVDNTRETKETIFVEVAGDEPRLTFDGYAVVRELVYVPWVGKDGKIKRAFRATSVTDASAASSGKSVQAA
jgi:hypothetical protein